MVFLLVTTSIMAVSIFLIYKLTNHFGFRMKYRSLILCAVMAFLVNISAIMLSPYLTQAHYLRLIVLVIGAAAIVTIYNERLVCREAHAADGNAAMVQQEEEEPLPSRLSAAMERLLHLAKRISKKPSAEPAATAPKKRMTIIAADPVPVVSEEALPAARSEAEPQPDDKPVSDIKKDKAAAPAEPTAAPSQKNAPKAAVVKQETAEPTDSATTKTAVATKKTTGPKTTATAATTPATEKPVATKPAEAKPAPAKPEATKPVAAKPASAKPEATKPAAAKPVPAKPEATKPVAAKPASAKPEAAKPVAAKPASAKPEAAKPAVAKPVPAKPTAAKPAATNATKTKPVTPAAVKPAVEKPANAKAVTAKASASKPVAAKPPAAQAAPAKTAVSKPTIPKSVAVNPALAKTVPPKIVTEVSNLSSMDDILDFAYSHKDQGNISEAVFAYKQALKRYRKDSYAPFLAIELGNIYKEQAAYDEAILTYADALTIPAIADDDATYQEFTKNLSYLRTVKYILSKHDALTVPFQKIPNDYMKEIETEFQTRHAQA